MNIAAAATASNAKIHVTRRDPLRIGSSRATCMGGVWRSSFQAISRCPTSPPPISGAGDGRKPGVDAAVVEGGSGTTVAAGIALGPAIQSLAGDKPGVTAGTGASEAGLRSIVRRWVEVTGGGRLGRGGGDESSGSCRA